MNTPEEYKKFLDEADRRDPGNKFVAGCRKFYEKKGFLSAKQIGSLVNVTMTFARDRKLNRASRRTRKYERDSGYERDDHMGFDPWDFGS